MTGIDTIPKELLTFANVRKMLKTSPLRRSEIPIEHLVSLPQPTRRWGQAAFAFFASPAQRLPGRPTIQATPDRYWGVAAHGGHLVFYALTSAAPLVAEAGEWHSVELPLPTIPLATMQDEVAVFEDVMTAASEYFFKNHPPVDKEGLADAWARFVPKPVWPFYRALAPDFWLWLGQ